MVRMRKSIKQNFARKAKRTRDRKRRREVLSSYWGWCKWGDCRHLWNVITDNDMSFAEHGINGRIETKDGKKFFDVKQVKATDILNMTIAVKDFVTDVKTKNGPGRYAVLIEIDGQPAKFITNSMTLKQQLDQARDKQILPITDTRLRRRDIGGGMSDYGFD